MEINIFDASEVPEKFVKFYNGIAFLSDNLDKAPIKIGSKVSKINSEKGDTNANGALGTVIGSIATNVFMVKWGMVKYGYTVVWDGNKTLPISIIDQKLKLIK